MNVFWIALAAAHSQQGNVNCSSPVNVGDAAISVSYWIEDANCTFVLNTTKVDAIGVSRVAWPLASPGWIEVNGNRTTEDTTVSGHIEPFAILPMWSTYSPKDVVLASPIVKVHVKGKAFVSFGMAEDPALILYGVVPDAYDSREWVYAFPSDAMWVFHLSMLAIVAGVSYGWRAHTDNSIRLWIIGSRFLDMVVWGVHASSEVGNAGGGFHIGVSTVRIFMLLYFWYIVSETPAYGPGEWTLCGITSQVPVAVLLWVYMFWVLYGGRAALQNPEVAYVLVPGLLAILALFEPYLGLAILHTLFGVVLNLGAGLLAPVCMLRAYYRRHATGRTLRLVHPAS